MSRITAVKKSLLAELAEGYDESCYAYVQPATIDDMVVVDEAKISKKSKREQVEFQKKFVSEHWLGGKVKIYEGNEFKLVDMEQDDCFASQSITDKLYLDIIGVDLDPKVLADLKAAAATSATQQQDEQNTETPSSEEPTQPEKTPSAS